MPQCRRFLGVNSVTNSDLDKGFLPVPIIRNEHWFEKFNVHPFPPVSGLCRQNLVTGGKDKGKSLECARSPS
ncbi:hypothetical protein FEM01_05200 [Pseudomonas mosselii]|uniref:Uncharacterized protein n=1 Tax=Pseudomonas mosselii TaxID=78327 RepID=A0A5R8ZDH3_9PSED|nr:hypothetical protein FEM01_05200 [Pseudomonas mosselii]